MFYPNSCLLSLGAEYLSAGIVKGAALSSELIHKGASKAKQKINPEDQPVVVDPRVKEGLRIAREASGVALKATGFLGTFLLSTSFLVALFILL